MRFHVVGYHYDAAGYGEFARLVATALDSEGHDVSTSPLFFRPEDPARFGWKGERVRDLRNDEPSSVDVVLVISSVQDFWKVRIPGAKHLGFTMIERDAPTELEGLLAGRMDGLLVPSAWNQHAFATSGVTIPVSVVHPPVDPQLIGATVRHPSTSFDFLSVFEWGAPHKDPVSLLTAYYLAFDPDEPVLLRIKSFIRDGNDDTVRRDVATAKAQAGLTGNPTPPVEVIIGSMTRTESVQLMRGADALVACHRAEGWALPLFEAMALGLPTISTAYGGCLEYLIPAGPGQAANSTLVPPHRVVDGRAEVAVPALALALRSVYDAPETSPRDPGGAGLAARFSIRATAKAIERASLL